MENLKGILDSEKKEFLKFLKSRFHLYHLSNVFFRDIHYGVMTYLEMKNVRYRYVEAEDLARSFVGDLEREGILRKIDNQTFTLMYPEFKKPSVKPAAPAKPASAAKPAPPAAAKPSPTKPAESQSAPSSQSKPVGESAGS